MTKQELYRDLCMEAGTLTTSTGKISCRTPEQWYIDCGHNIHPGLDEDLAKAAAGDVQALIDARNAVGLAPW